jgi:hypothetical protein
MNIYYFYSKQKLNNMKKLLIAICMLFGLAVVSNAQTTTTTSAKQTKPKVAKTTAAGPTKKDGTPDMRYKANKTTAKPVGPLKKDGTPDKRYKANKTPAATKTTTTPKS